MTESSGSVTIYEGNDGILLFGSEQSLALFDERTEVSARPLSKRDVARFGGQVSAGAAVAQAESGRWVKLTQESARLVKELGSTSIGKDGLQSGVVRGDKGKIVKHLRFENVSKAGALTPAAPAVLGSMATQYALDAALDEILTYLETIDLKLDQLLKQRKTETLGQIGGVRLALDEADAIFAETGAVSTVTWSKIQATSLALQTMQAEAIAQLHAVADNVAAAAGNVDRAASALEQATTDTEFWLGSLAHTIALQDRQYRLELARVADEDVAQLEAHHRGIVIARADRVRRVVAGLDSMADAMSKATVLTNADKVANPINAPKVTRQANAVAAAMAAFAAHTDLEIRDRGSIAITPWSRAARGLLGEASSAVGTASSSVADRARAAAAAVEDRRERSILRRAEKIREKRRKG